MLGAGQVLGKLLPSFVKFSCLLINADGCVITVRYSSHELKYSVITVNKAACRLSSFTEEPAFGSSGIPLCSTLFQLNLGQLQWHKHSISHLQYQRGLECKALLQSSLLQHSYQKPVQERNTFKSMSMCYLSNLLTMLSPLRFVQKSSQQDRIHHASCTATEAVNQDNSICDRYARVISSLSLHAPDTLLHLIP